MDQREFAKALQRAKLYANPPINDEEAWFAAEANLILDDARAAFFATDPAGARAAISQAIAEARRIRYSLDEVVDEVIYRGEGFPPYISVEVGKPVAAELAGEPAIRRRRNAGHPRWPQRPSCEKGPCRRRPSRGCRRRNPCRAGRPRPASPAAPGASARRRRRCAGSARGRLR